MQQATAGGRAAALGMFGKNRFLEVADSYFPRVAAVGAELFGGEYREWRYPLLAVVHVRPVDGSSDDPERSLVHQLEEDRQGRGVYPPAKRQEHARSVMEQADRLNRHVSVDENQPRHLTSTESRNPERGMRGGAVVVPLDGTECIIAVDGFSPQVSPSFWGEHASEALALVLAMGYAGNDELLAERIAQIMERTENVFFFRLRNAIFGPPKRKRSQ